MWKGKKKQNKMKRKVEERKQDKNKTKGRLAEEERGRRSEKVNKWEDKKNW